MGGLLHLFDFNQGSMARKLFTHKKHDGGLDAPRNSLEMQVEPQSYCDTGDLPVEENWSRKNNPLESSMKKLINEEISKHSSTRQNAPNIVARLMGMDMLPVEPKSAVVEEKRENRRTKSSKKEMKGRSSVGRVSSNLNSSKQIDLDSYYHSNDRDATRWSDEQKIENPRRREHPQEKELQKFKKEFEAWQASRFRECSRFHEIDSDLNEEKMAVSGHRTTQTTLERKDHAVKEISHEESDLQHRGNEFSELFPAEQKGSFSSRSKRTMSLDFEQSSLVSSKKRFESFDASSPPTRIVILRPGPDRLCNHEEAWTGSSNTLERKGGIEDFLEEVKEQLRCELQGKMHKRGSVVRGSGIETPFSEQPSSRKQIARHIANQVRESVTRDLGMNLLRSESTRSYRTEMQFNASGSPEFMHRDTKRILLGRLRNVSKIETELHDPSLVSGRSRLSALDYERERGVVKDEHENTRSFRHGSHGDEVLDRELSPRNLIRSLSAPVPGTSFGKLLLEDRHVLTGAHIQRKHEGIGPVSMEMKHQKKERFNFKEKVSNLRYSFMLRGRLFGKKNQSVPESRHTERYPMKDIMSGPTVITNSGERHDNFTEVPPSPASVCSTAREEFWRPTDYLSPISTPSATPREDGIVPQAFRDISDNLSELRRQLNQLESNEPEGIKVEEAVESEMARLDNPAEVYIRDLLVVSGLYDGSFDKSLSRWDTFAKPISNSVFEEVEESYKNLANKQDPSATDHNEMVNHKVLRDLLNEALSTVLGPPISMPNFRRKMINSSALPPLRGKKLLNCVWRIICECLYPPTNVSCYSLDDMAARELGSGPWSGLMDEDVNAVGREIESLIMAEKELELETLLKASAYILGATGSSIMYKAVLEDGSSLAVRRIGEQSVDRFKDFENQIKLVAKLVHPNLVRIRGFYWGVDEKLIIYDFVPNGSLANARYRKVGSSPCHLPWEARLKIAKGVARGLAYLHEKKHVHGNLKPTNILLDADMEPRIGDFGLERLLSGDTSYKMGSSTRNFGSKRSMTSRDGFQDFGLGPSPGPSPSPSSMGTSPYHCPESLRSLKPNPKWDVYSFGVILLELLTGKVVVVDEAGLGVDDSCKALRMADMAIRGELEGKEEALLSLFKLGYNCASPVPQKRPTMKEALQVLGKFPSSPSSSYYCAP